MTITIEQSCPEEETWTVRVTTERDPSMEEAISATAAALYCYFGWGNERLYNSLVEEIEKLMAEK